MDIQWIKAVANRSPKTTKEVSVRVEKYKDGTPRRTKITFRRQSEKKISHTDYLICGCALERLYFDENALGKGGYKISKPTNASSVHISVPAILTEFVGDYDLRYDSVKNLYYIDREENDNGQKLKKVSD